MDVASAFGVSRIRALWDLKYRCGPKQPTFVMNCRKGGWFGLQVESVEYNENLRRVSGLHAGFILGLDWGFTYSLHFSAF